MKDKEPVLCYVKNNCAYFTTQDLEEQWGDDWDDKFYEHNAGEPYGPCWHNEPRHRNDPEATRGWKPGTKEPYAVGEMCQCECCLEDWNPDGTPKFEIVKLYFESDLVTPNHTHSNSPYSVQDINAGEIPWLRPWGDSAIGVKLWAGTTLSHFKHLIMENDGEIYERVCQTVHK